MGRPRRCGFPDVGVPVAAETVAWWAFGGEREDWVSPYCAGWLQVVWLRYLGMIGQHILRHRRG